MANVLVWAVWVVAAFACLGSGIAVVTFSNPFYSALSLIGNLASLAVLGAPAWMCALGGTLMFLQEFTRARAAAAGQTEVGVVTVWERPTRVIVTASFLVATAVLGNPWPALGAAVWVGLGALGVGQLLVVVHRRLG